MNGRDRKQTIVMIHDGYWNRPIYRYPLRFLPLAVVFLLIISGICCSPSTVRKPSQAPESPSGDSGEVAPQKEGWKFIVCGDPQNNYDVFGKILEAARSVDFLVIAGDLTGSGSEQEFQNFASVMARSGIRYYAVPGNHDVCRSPASGLYEKYIGKPSLFFEHKNVFFLLIDNSSPEVGLAPGEIRRAESALEKATKTGCDHIIAVCHVPPGYPYSLSITEQEKEAMQNNERLIPLLKAHGVKELFCGHFHAFRQEISDGVRITITGGAGAPLHVSERNGGYFHYVLVEVVKKSLRMKVVRV